MSKWTDDHRQAPNPHACRSLVHAIRYLVTLLPTGDETTSEDGIVPGSCYCGTLDDDADDEDADVDQDGVLSGQDLGEEARIHRA